MTEPIVSVAEMREIEARSWAAGRVQSEVIRAAGHAVARVLRRLTTEGAPILVLAGRGHNGDDALEAGRALADREVCRVRIGEDGALEQVRAWLSAHGSRADAWVVDGLFGIGLNRPVEGEAAGIIAALNASQVRVLAVDVPSGLDADSGEPLGIAVEADVTVTLGAVKHGLVVESAAPHVGRLELAAEIGLLPWGEVLKDPAEAWTVDADFLGFPPRRPVSGHKGTFGHVAIIAGSEGYHGAAVLAASGALRARPGLVTVFTQERTYVPVASQLRAAMVHPWNGGAIDADRYTSVVVGPGLASPRLGFAVRCEVERLWRSAPCVVLADASALDLLPRSLDAGAGPRVITPHPGEAARMLGLPVAEVQSDRFGAVRELAGLWPSGRIIAVLKGRHTLVAERTGPVFVNSSGNPGLAQGGSGDVLAGYLGGLIAQPGLGANLLQTVRFGVWRHGATADELEAGGRAWGVDDLVGALEGSADRGG